MVLKTRIGELEDQGHLQEVLSAASGTRRFSGAVTATQSRNDCPSGSPAQDSYGERKCGIIREIDRCMKLLCLIS